MRKHDEFGQIDTERLELVKERLSKRLFDFRKERGLSQLEVAFRSGLAIRTIAYAERSDKDRDPNIGTLVALASAYKIKLSDIFDGIEDD